MFPDTAHGPLGADGTSMYVSMQVNTNRQLLSYTL